MTSGARGIGEVWEESAAKYLEARGLRIVLRHYVCRLGEIDLIATHGETIVFVEVRFRSRSDWGTAAASVTAHKQRRILRAAQHFIMRNAQYAQRPMRLDVVAFQSDAARDDRGPHVQWIRDAFPAN